MKKILISLSIILLFCCPSMSFAKFSLGTSVFKQSVLENNLYVLGSGKTLEEAMTNAQVQLARIFETQVSAEYTENTSSDTVSSKQKASEQIQTVTNTIISGLKVKNVNIADGQFFVTAYLNKEEVSAILYEEINALDMKLLTLVTDDSATSIRSMKKLYKQREELNKRYVFLNNGVSLAEKVPYSKIFEKNKQSFVGKKVSVKILNDIDGEITYILKKLLVDSGYALSETDYDFQIKGKLSMRNIPINVEGFLKNTYTLVLESSDNTKKTLGISQ